MLQVIKKMIKRLEKDNPKMAQLLSGIEWWERGGNNVTFLLTFDDVYNVGFNKEYKAYYKIKEDSLELEEYKR